VTRHSPLGLTVAALAALILGGAAAAPAAADDGGGSGPGGGDRRTEVEVRGGCDPRLRLRAEDGRIRVDFELHSRSLSRWAVVVLHERRIVSRGTYRAGSGGSFELRRFVGDWYGSDTIAVNATGPGQTCRVSATI
jgi:hypothetical protein